MQEFIRTSNNYNEAQKARTCTGEQMKFFQNQVERAVTELKIVTFTIFHAVKLSNAKENKRKRMFDVYCLTYEFLLLALSNKGKPFPAEEDDQRDANVHMAIRSI
jgi:hypothetical protein